MWPLGVLGPVLPDDGAAATCGVLLVAAGRASGDGEAGVVGHGSGSSVEAPASPRGFSAVTPGGSTGAETDGGDIKVLGWLLEVPTGFDGGRNAGIEPV